MVIPLFGRDLAAICLDCRLALDDGEECPDGQGHERASLGAPRGREALRGRVWGGRTAPPAAILEALLRRFELPWLSGPRGPRVAPEADLLPGITGVAEGQARPLARSLIFAFEDSSQRTLLLRDARTDGFTISRRDGSRIHVRAGRLTLTGLSDRTGVTAPDPETRQLLPFNVVLRSLVLPGDAVTLHSAVEERIDHASPPGLYRDRPPVLHVARPPVVLSVGGLRILDRPVRLVNRRM